jgi:hypothetical protein
VAPLVGSATDALGPNAVMRALCAITAARASLWLVFPGRLMAVYIADTVLNSCLRMMLPVQATIANMFKDDRRRLVSTMSTLFAMPDLCQIIFPVVGGFVAAHSPALVFVISVGSAVLSGVIFALGMRSDSSMPRSPFKW